MKEYSEDVIRNKIFKGKDEQTQFYYVYYEHYSYGRGFYKNEGASILSLIVVNNAVGPSLS